MSNDRFEGNRLLYRSVVSLRAYGMERTPDSRVYPRLGIGAEAGYSFRWTKNLFAPSAYAYLYGYLPGLHETHGLRWSVLGVKRFDGMYSEAYANVAPRGYQSAVLNRLASYEKAVKGALVQELPDDYETITLDGEEYYKVDDTVYKLTIIDGSPYFEVLGQLTGTLAQKYDLYESL